MAVMATCTLIVVDFCIYCVPLTAIWSLCSRAHAYHFECRTIDPVPALPITYLLRLWT